jgi:hypothetical protein
VAMMVVLLEGPDGEFCLRSDLVSKLARLGITNLAVVRDRQTVGIVLEGWTFDPVNFADTATAAVAAGGRTLRPVMQLAVSTAAREGGRNVRDISHARP